MLRRVVRAFRIASLSLGLLMLLWLPVSWVYSVWLISPWPGDHARFVFGDGVLWINIVTQAPEPSLNNPMQLAVHRITERGSLDDALLPSFQHIEWPEFSVATRNAVIPLWLLAAVCLAWPVTSLLVRRRRRGRGFEVEAKGGGAVSTLDS